MRDDILLNVVKLTYVSVSYTTEQVTPVAQSFIDAVTEFEVIAPERAAVTV